MSAICGIVNLDRQAVEVSAIERVMTALEAYGADGAVLWQEDNAALGHQMLHITPESLQEKLPWQDEVTGLVITADARIDNREELFAALTISPQAGRELSDSQLILRSYIKWGEQCPSKLLGDFAFAIWDARHQKLFCARDIMGVRPFYYYSSKTCFVFASDIKGLLAAPMVSRQLNEVMIAVYLTEEETDFMEKSLTFYQRIFKLPSASFLVVTPTAKKISSYWSPENAPQIKLSSEAEYQEMLCELLTRAIKCRLRSAFPIGAHLSGGLDSSAIAVIASRILRDRGQCLTGFSWSPPLTDVEACSNDERTLVKEICDREQIKCQYVSLKAQDFTHIRTRDFTLEPTEMLYFEQKVQATAAQSKIRVLFSGWGGDEAITFNGRGYFAELFQQGRWWTLYRELKLRGGLHGINLRRQIFDKVFLPLLPDRIFALIEEQLNLKEQHSQSSYINPQFAREVQAQIAQLPRLDRVFREQAGVRANQTMLLANGHITNRIEAWAISGAKNNLVYSYPLLDRRILEFALGIPVDLFFKHGWKRYLFRSATESILPHRVRWNKTKIEPAWLEQWNTCQKNSLKTLEKIASNSFQTNRHSAKLAEYINLERLEQALINPEQRQPGFWTAITLAINFAEIQIQ